MQPGATRHSPYGMGAERQLSAVGCSPMAHTRTLLGAPQTWPYNTGCHGALSCTGWVLGAQPHRGWVLCGPRLSPTIVSLCCGAPAGAIE